MPTTQLRNSKLTFNKGGPVRARASIVIYFIYFACVIK